MSQAPTMRPPDRAWIQTEETTYLLVNAGGESWTARDIEVLLQPSGQGLAVRIYAPNTPLVQLHLRWRQPVSSEQLLLGDHWERSYGDLEWRGIIPERVMPWYFLAREGYATGGCGVKTGAGAMCFWRVDSEGLSLHMDLRSGGVGVVLGERMLEAATIVATLSDEDETPFQAARNFCRQLCDSPRLPVASLYGGNNWYYAYGDSSHVRILDDAKLLADHSPAVSNRPFMTVDAGWQRRGVGDPATGGPWDCGNERFPDMPGLADAMREMGARPGIWIRPLAASPDAHPGNLLPERRMLNRGDAVPTLDPSQPDVLARVEQDIRTLRGWGYELIKHDFTTYDCLGRWGYEMGSEVASPGWQFEDRSRTTAEILTDLYRAIRRATGDGLVLGCNTVGHLAAGLVEIQRVGDDTSGRDWERTRKMGINALAFRLCQHGTFFAADADCVGLTGKVPWDKNFQWMDLLSRSGTPLWVSAEPDAVGPEQSMALRAAFAQASRTQSPAEPLDWLQTTSPRDWAFEDQALRYDWTSPDGVIRYTVTRGLLPAAAADVR